MGIFLNGVGAGSFKLTFAGTDLTDHVKSVTINQEWDDQDVTAMGATAKAHKPGLRDDSIDVEFFQDFAAGSTDLTIRPYLGSATGGTLVIIAGGTAVSATTPSFTLVGSPFTYSPVDGSVGDASMTKITFKPAAGQSIVYATA